MNLDITPNPHRGTWHIITLSCQLNNATLVLRYIPERDIAVADIFSQWAEKLSASASNWEDAAASTLSHFYDTVLPFYVDLTLTHDHSSGTRQKVFVFQEQPKVNIPDHLRRLLEQN